MCVLKILDVYILDNRYIVKRKNKKLRFNENKIANTKFMKNDTNKSYMLNAHKINDTTK